MVEEFRARAAAAEHERNEAQAMCEHWLGLRESSAKAVGGLTRRLETAEKKLDAVRALPGEWRKSALELRTNFDWKEGVMRAADWLENEIRATDGAEAPTGATT